MFTIALLLVAIALYTMVIARAMRGSRHCPPKRLGGLFADVRGTLYTIEELPKTSQEAIRVFDERYIAGTAQAPILTWANRLGDVTDVSSPLTTFPTSILSLKFQENKGQNRFTSLREQGFDLKVVEFDEGVQADLIGLKTNSYVYRKWQDAPDRLRRAEARHVQRRVALDILEANPKCAWDKLSLFNDAHLVNPGDPGGDTFDNLQSTPKDVLSITNIETELGLMMQQVKDDNDENLIEEPDWAIVVPPAKYLPLVDLLKQDVIARAITNQAGTENVGGAGVTNPFKGLIEVVNAPQLTDTNDWYIVDKNLIAAGMVPWIAARWDAGPELTLRVFDESSDFFKNSGRIAISNHIWYGFAAVFPHAIRKVVGA